jgi:hypothetical protein
VTVLPRVPIRCHDRTVSIVGKSHLGTRTVAFVLVGALALIAVVWLTRTIAADDETASCRSLNDPSRMAPLSPAILDDLHSSASRLNPADLTTPSEQEAGVANALSSHFRSGAWVCGVQHSEGLVAITHYKAEDNSGRCFGVSCPAPKPLPRVWVTCYSRLDLSDEPSVVAGGGCIGFRSSDRH